jgi:hypothetical protein
LLWASLAAAACSNPGPALQPRVGPRAGDARAEAPGEQQESAARGPREREPIPTRLSSGEIWERFLRAAQSGQLNPAAVGDIFGIREQPLRPGAEFQPLRLERHPRSIAPAFDFRLVPCLPPNLELRPELCPGGRPALFLAMLGPFEGGGGAGGSACVRNVEAIERLRASGWTLIDQHVPRRIPHGMLVALSPDKLTRPGREIAILPPTYVGKDCVGWISLRHADSGN